MQSHTDLFADSRRERARSWPGAPLTRAWLLAVLLSSVPSIAVGRVLALALSFRFRRLQEPGLSINLPVNMPERMLTVWSSMPSDHAVMFLPIAVALLFVSAAQAGWQVRLWL